MADQRGIVAREASRSEPLGSIFSDDMHFSLFSGQQFSMIVKKYIRVAKMSSTVYEKETCFAYSLTSCLIDCNAFNLKHS